MTAMISLEKHILSRLTAVESECSQQRRAQGRFPRGPFVSGAILTPADSISTSSSRDCTRTGSNGSPSVTSAPVRLVISEEV